MKAPHSFDVLVVGSLNSDFLVRGPSLPRPGETVSGTMFFQGPGGKGANQAVAAARLGARVAMVGKVGADVRGSSLLRGLRKEGGDTRCVERDANSFTGAAVIMVDAKGEKQICAAAGANHSLTPTEVRRAFQNLPQTKVVLLQLEVPLPAVIEAARLGQAMGAKVILDPAPAVSLPDDRLLRMLDFIRPNGSEAAALTVIRIRNLRSARRAAQALIERGVGAVMLPAESGGDLLVWPGGERFFPYLRVKSIDATGAGDAVAGALAVAIAEGQTLEQAGRFAMAAGALATTKIGAQSALPTQAELTRLLERTRTVSLERGERANPLREISISA